ncbi:hypothetical protein CoNPh26_CDS0025 [Staphylococcus phage S-CoN_Ph26]|nr:hypothetical protein CoNPh26_CDS0025 [Staphylococcus phage S-CoN_Ph26]
MHFFPISYRPVLCKCKFITLCKSSSLTTLNK